MISKKLSLLVNMAKVQSVISKQFDALSVHGLGFSDYMILYLLSNAQENKMRRIDLAAKIGLTASGITRSLIPLEKIGLVERETHPRDARVSYVVLTATGQQVFEEATATAERVAKEVLSSRSSQSLQGIMEFISELGGNI